MFAVGNILNRAHNYFQDFWKRFSIFNKAQQLQLNRKTETNQKKREREAHLGLTCAGPAHLARPSRLALPVVVLLPPGGRGARGRRPRPHAGHLLLLPTPWRRPGMPRRPPRPPLILPHSPPRLPHPLPRWPSAILAAVRRRRHQSHPLAPPTSPIAPPRRPGPLR